MTEPIRLTHKQVTDHLRELKLKQGYLYSLAYGYWRDPAGTGYQPEKEGSIRDIAPSLIPIGGSYALYELVDQELAARIAAKKCSADHVLGAQLVQMLTVAPMNMSFRAQVMAAVGVMPAPELDTYDKIRDWVESTFDALKLPDRVMMPTSYGVGVRIQKHISGRCDFSGIERHSSTVNVQHIIDQHINSTEGGTSLRLLNDLIRDEAIRLANVMADNNDVNMEFDHDTMEYNDHGTTSTGQIEVAMTSGSESMLVHLRDHINGHYPVNIRRRFGL